MSDVFPFFADEKNLEALTPPWLGFQVLGKSTPEMKEGTEIRYRLRLYGIPLYWKSLITDWRPGHGFTDSQKSGPYRRWVHRHEFFSVRGGTLMTDEVEYELPGGQLGEFLALSKVRRDLEAIFDYRLKKAAELFDRPSREV